MCVCVCVRVWACVCVRKSTCLYIFAWERERVERKSNGKYVHATNRTRTKRRTNNITRYAVPHALRPYGTIILHLNTNNVCFYSAFDLRTRMYEYARINTSSRCKRVVTLVDNATQQYWRVHDERNQVVSYTYIRICNYIHMCDLWTFWCWVRMKTVPAKSCNRVFSINVQGYGQNVLREFTDIHIDKPFR